MVHVTYRLSSEIAFTSQDESRMMADRTNSRKPYTGIAAREYFVLLYIQSPVPHFGETGLTHNFSVSIFCFDLVFK